MKLKESNAVKTTDERLLRQYSERVRHLTERNAKYKKLLKERDLEAREFLTHELESEKEKTEVLEKGMGVCYTGRLEVFNTSIGGATKSGSDAEEHGQ